MKKDIIKLFFCFIILFLAVGFVSADEDLNINENAYENNINSIEELNYEDNNLNKTETNSIEDLNHECNEDIILASNDIPVTNWAGLKNAINTANIGEVIILQNDIIKPDNLEDYDGLYITTNNIVIDGNGKTLDGNNYGRLFYIHANNVIIKNLILINGYYHSRYFGDDADGGAIKIFESMGTKIINCTFKNNLVRHELIRYMNDVPNGFAYGGAISNEISHYSEIINSTFINNSAYCDIQVTYINNDVEIYAHGGAISSVHSLYEKITGNIFINNTALADGENPERNTIIATSNGGAIYIGSPLHTGSAQYVNINHNKFLDNSAIAHGAGGFSDGRGFGGAIYISEVYNIFLNNNDFVNNFADFSGFYGESGGGAIYIYETDTDMNSNYFINNTAGNGGAIYSVANLNVKHSIFCNNNNYAVYIYPGYSANLSNNFWGVFYPEINNLIARNGNNVIFDHFIRVKLVFDTAMYELFPGDDLVYHVNIIYTEISNRELGKVPSGLLPDIVLVPNLLLDKSFIAQENTVEGDQTIEITDFPIFDIYLYFYDSVVDNYPYYCGGLTDLTINLENQSGTYQETTVTGNVSDLKLDDNITVELWVDDVYFESTRTINGTFTFNLNSVISGNHSIQVKVNLQRGYNDINSTICNLEIFKKSSKITINGTNTTYGEYLSCVIRGNDIHSDIIIIINYENDTIAYWNYPYTNFQIINLVFPNNFSAGKYSVNVTVLESDYFYATSNITYLEIYKQTPSLNINVNDVDYGENITINVNLTGVNHFIYRDTIEYLNGTILIKIGTNEYTVDITNGSGSKNIGILPSENYYINAFYEGNQYYSNITNNNVNFNVNPTNTYIDIYVENVTYGDKTVFNIIFPYNTTGKFNLTLDNGLYNNSQIIIINNNPMIIDTNLISGIYTITVNYLGDVNFNPSEMSKTFEVYKTSSILDIYVADVFYDEDVIVYVNLTNLKGIGLNANVTFKIGGKEYNITVLNGLGSKNIGKFSSGNYIINAFYNGDENYNNVSNNAFSFNVNRKNSFIDIIVNNATYGNETIVNIVFSNGVSGQFNFTLNNGSHNITETIDITNNLMIINRILNSGFYIVYVKYLGDNQFHPSENSTSFEVYKSSSILDIYVDDVFYDEDVIVYVNLTNFKGIDLNGNVTVKIDDNEYNITVSNGFGTNNIGKLSSGNYLINAFYSGNENYNGVLSNTISFNVNRKNSFVDLTINSVEYSTDTLFIINFSNGVSGQFNFTLINISFSSTETIDITSDLMTINRFLVAGFYAVQVKFLGDDRFYPSEIIKVFEVYKIPSILNIHVNNIFHDEDIVVHANLTDREGIGLNATVIFEIEGSEHYINVDNGYGNKNIGKLSSRNYIINAFYNGSQNYKESIDTHIFTIYKEGLLLVNLTIDPINMTANENTIVEVKVTGQNETVNIGIITLEFNNKKYFANVSNGVAKVNITAPDMINIYNVYVLYNGLNVYVNQTTNTILTVNKVITILNVDIPDVSSDENGTITIIIPGGDATGNIIVKINKTEYTVELIKGIATITLPILEPNDYPVTITYDGDNKYNSAISNSSLTVKNDFKTVMIVKNITMYYKGGNRLIVLLTNTNNNSLSNVNVTFHINNMSYTRTTNGTGYASLALNLNPGEYPVYTIFNGYHNYSRATVNSTVLINPTILGEDLIKYYRNDSQYYVTILDNEGNPLKDIDVEMNINGGIYTRKTNDEGKAMISINLNPGNYTITIKHPNDDLQISNNIIVLTRINGNDISKYYRNDTQYYASLVDSIGKPLANKQVTMNINGVFYNRTTDDNGLVKLTINLNPGIYIITVYDPETGQSYSNTITVLSILTANDLNKTFLESASYNMKLVDEKGNPLIGRNITINIHGVFYIRMTDNEGIARLNINLDPGSYIATATYGGYFTSNIIRVY